MPLISSNSKCTAYASRSRAARESVCLKASLAALSILLALQLLPLNLKKGIASPYPGRQTANSVTLDNPDFHFPTVQYLIYLPQGYSNERQWPLLLFLHGGGQRGDDLSLVAKHGPPALIASGMHVPMIVVSPLCPLEERWYGLKILDFLSFIEKEFSVDHDRIYISGYSMGCAGAWNIASLEPNRFAAAVFVCGYTDINKAKDLAKLPIWIFHGTQDEIIPLNESIQAVEAIESNGGHPRHIFLENQGHDICDLVFSRDDLYPWLLEQHHHNNNQ